MSICEKTIIQEQQQDGGCEQIKGDSNKGNNNDK